MSHVDDAITIKPINTKQLFRCNFTQFANSNVAFHRPHQHLDSGPATLPTHPNFTMYTQENRMNDDGRLNENRFGHPNNASHIPPPPPLPNHNANPAGPSHHSLLVNNTYTIKRELRNNHHFMAQSNSNNNHEPSSLNFISGHHNNYNNSHQNIKVTKKKLNTDKPNCQQLKGNPIVGQFENNLNSMTNFGAGNNLNSCRQTPTGMYPPTAEHEDNVDDPAENSLPDFQSYSIQQIDLQQPQSNNFFSLPYQQANYHQYNGQETCVKYPQQPHASLTVDRQNFNQRNCVNSHCHSSNHKKPATSFLATSQPAAQGQFGQSAENYNPSNVLSSSIEDLRNEASSKQQQPIDERALQPTALISALRSSISSERQRLYKEQLRNELAMKLKMKTQINHFQSQTSNLGNLGAYLYRKKPKYKFFSQLYFLFHISFTLCLFKVSEIDKENHKTYGEMLNFYFGYLLATAIMFLLAQMCCKNVNSNKELRSQNTSIVSFGCISLGLIQLITIGLDLVNCMNSELLFLPVLQFAFVFLLMHFILTQTKESHKYFYNNVSLAHLFVTQASIWLGHFRQRGSNCGYFQVASSDLLANSKLYAKSDAFDEKLLNDTLADDSRHMPTILLSGLTNSTIGRQPLDKLKSSPIESTIQIATVAAIQFATNASSTFSDLLMPMIHHFQILTVFILISIWINNNKTKMNYQRTRLCETESINCFNEPEFVSNNFLSSSSKLKSIKGLFMGLLVISTTVIMLTTGNDYFLIATHSSIQMISVLVTLFALLVKGRKRKGLQKLPQIINLEEFHLFVITSLICAYFCSFSAIILNLTARVLIFENLIDSLLLTVHITLQTLLLRSDGRKLDKLRDVHAFLIFANFSLWILEITEIASINGTNYNLFNLNVLPQIIVSLNRFYSSLLCIHFWKAK